MFGIQWLVLGKRYDFSLNQKKYLTVEFFFFLRVGESHFLHLWVIIYKNTVVCIMWSGVVINTENGINET